MRPLHMPEFMLDAGNRIHLPQASVVTTRVIMHFETHATEVIPWHSQRGLQESAFMYSMTCTDENYLLDWIYVYGIWIY